MVTIQLTGRINAQGELELELPDGLPTGEVQVTLAITSDDELPWELRPWTDEEIAAMNVITPKTGAEIVAAGHIGGWEHYDITDSVAWVDAQRSRF